MIDLTKFDYGLGIVGDDFGLKVDQVSISKIYRLSISKLSIFDFKRISIFRAADSKI